MRQNILSTALRSAVALSAFAGVSVSAATLTVGPGKTYSAPCKAFAVAKSGDLINITGNTTYTGDVCTIRASNIMIRGVNGRPKINAANKSAQGKGTWVVAGNNVTIENVEMYGAKSPSNASALRLEGTNFTLRLGYLHDNMNGILSGVNTASKVVLEYNEFSHNGGGTGQTHNVYIGKVGSLSFQYNYSHDANVGHNLKSRALVNKIAYNRFSSSGLGKPSYEIDLPNAGSSTIVGNVIQQPSSPSNPGMIAYGQEGAGNPGHDLYVVNNTFLNDDSTRGTFVVVNSKVRKKIVLQNNIFAGAGTVTNQTGAIQKTNYRAMAPGFVDRKNFDLRPTSNAQIVNAASAPGYSSGGVSLKPGATYRHRASGVTRPVKGALDIGAYEAQ